MGNQLDCFVDRRIKRLFKATGTDLLVTVGKVLRSGVSLFRDCV